MNILNIVQNRIYIRNIRAIIQSVRTPKSGVSGLIPGVFPGVFQIRSIRAYTRSLRARQHFFLPRTEILMVEKLAHQN